MFSSYFQTDTSSAMVLYTIIFFVSVFLAYLSQPSSSSEKINKFCYSILFVFLWVFFALNDIGADLGNYRSIYNFSDDGFETSGMSVEEGYIFINYLFHFITEEQILGVVLIRTLQLFVVFIALSMLKNKVQIVYPLMAYVAIAYFPTFNMLRLGLAFSGCLISYALLTKGKVLWCVVIAALMFFIHRSSMFFLVAILLFLLAYYTPMFKNSAFMRKILWVSAISLCVYGVSIISFFLSTGFFSERYDGYMYDEGTSGTMVFILYAPLFYLYYLYNTISENNEDIWKRINFTLMLIGLVVAILGYQIGILTRANTYFLIPFMFFMGSLLKDDFELSPSLRKILPKFLLLYWYIRFLFNMQGSLHADGINIFRFI